MGEGFEFRQRPPVRRNFLAEDRTAPAACLFRAVPFPKSRGVEGRRRREKGPAKIVRRHHPPGVHQIVECGRPELGDPELPEQGRRSGQQPPDVLDGVLQPLGIGDGDLPMSLHRQIAEILRGERKSEAVSPGRKVAVHHNIRERDTVLGCRPRRRGRTPSPQPVEDLRGQKSGHSGGIGEFDIPAVNLDPIRVGTPTGDDDPVPSRLLQHGSEISADGSVADGSGERRTGHDRHSAGGRRCGVDQRSGEQQQRHRGVVPAAGRLRFEVSPGQPAPAEAFLVSLGGRPAGFPVPRRQIHCQYFSAPSVHRFLFIPPAMRLSVG